MPWFAEFCPFMLSFRSLPGFGRQSAPEKTMAVVAAESRALSDRGLQPYLPTTRQN
jgi:hypothetical protein